MGAQGTATLDFGVWPGSWDASVAVTGQASIVAGSLVEAWLYPAATADHSADEHRLEQLRVVAGDVVAGTGFTIYGYATTLPEPLALPGVSTWRVATGQILGGAGASVGGITPRVYGTWSIGWVWN